ncbi:MAG TPA: DUF1684 domain-containing protein [Pseudomonadales bacterium]
MSRRLRLLVLAVLTLGAGPARSDDASYLASLASFREYTDFRFRDRILSPLPEAERLRFAGLRYFDPDPGLALRARFEPARDTSSFAMPTFDRRTLSYAHYGTFEVMLNGQPVRLKAFRRTEADTARHLLLIPFRDSTNGRETYAGGRYIEIALPIDSAPVLDFNRATNPLCAYDASYACPIPPPENRLAAPIRAGEMAYP